MSSYHTEAHEQRPAREAPASGAFQAGDERPQRDRPPMHLNPPSTNSIDTASKDGKSWGQASSVNSPDLGEYSPDLPILNSQRMPADNAHTVSFGDDLPKASNYGNPGPSSSNANGADVKRKKSLVRPDREKLDPSHRLWNYRTHAAAMEADGTGRIGPSSTGNYPQAGIGLEPPSHSAAYAALQRERPTTAQARPAPLRRGKSILAREEDLPQETGAAIIKRGATIRRKQGKVGRTEDMETKEYKKKRGPLGPWTIWYRTVTCMFPSGLLKMFGFKTKERQTAWREKVGLLSVIMSLMAAVGFLTFGFTQTVCGRQATRYRSGTVPQGSMIFHGYTYSMDTFRHPGAAGIQENSNPLYSDFNAGGMDGSFLFQKVNQKCYGIITPSARTGIPTEGLRMGWYFPCNMYNQYGTSTVNLTGYPEGNLCHTSNLARTQFAETRDERVLGMQREGPVYYLWDDIRNDTRNLAVYQSAVLDLNLLNWLGSSQVNIPAWYTSLARGNDTYRGRDISMQIMRDRQTALADCLVDLVRVGFVDSKTIGCIAADIVLYVSLVFIIGVVFIKFCLAVFFGWFLSWRLGGYPKETLEARRARAAEIENWTEDIYRPAPASYRPNVRKSMFPTKSRFSTAPMKTQLTGNGNRISTYGTYPRSYSSNLGPPSGKVLGQGMKNSPPGSPGGLSGSRSSSTLVSPIGYGGKDSSRGSSVAEMVTSCPWPLHNVIPQPPSDYEPFNYPLVHTICLVTAYSESVEGLRTTIDSLATTDYPNSHKVILVIADGMVKGSGNNLTTPEICLTMMKDFVIAPRDVEAYSYVAIADGHKRHNMAKVYAGFYSYDDKTIESSKQQRVPMLLVAKVGNPLEAHEAKPGNRGKRDSQVLLMSFLQKIMFDERMTTFDYEFFNSWWRCTGISPDNYQICLMVDADTKVFPDSLSRMVACMVRDPEIMGLCGETKIANKAETWVTMIQVFEYYISHHLTKAFESMFGGVTCLPGCFSMYRIKAPKGNEDYWVPIIANPDIVEHYSENVVDTLHKKNLLLLGEDRYMTTLLLKTFPRRKNMFCPQAVCKTVVPDTFRVLLSQRRRWINSTIHNLFELVLVRDLCGTFCFSMQFVVFMELVGTLVLPAAIAFTLYLIIIACIPSQPTPTIPLILLAIILGLPGLLIVVTSRRLAYVGWMVIYLFSLPIWNFVLPAYAYLHMDDFSWGETRKIVGDKGGDHSDKAGTFDSTHIVMKRWGEFERERRWKATQHSRDSTYEVVRSQSPRPVESHRLSGGSSSETAYTVPGYIQDHAVLRHNNAAAQPLLSSQYGGPFGEEAIINPASRFQGPTLPSQLELPAPLATHSSHVSNSSSRGSDQHLRGSSATRASTDYPRYTHAADAEEQQAILSSSPDLSEPSHRGRSDIPRRSEEFGLLRQSESYSDEPDTYSPIQDDRRAFPTVQASTSTDRSSIASRFAGVSLRDDGPVAAEGGFVQRTRRTSQPLTSRTASQSAGDSAPSLPPGARR